MMRMYVCPAQALGGDAGGHEVGGGRFSPPSRPPAFGRGDPHLSAPAYWAPIGMCVYIYIYIYVYIYI